MNKKSLIVLIIIVVVFIGALIFFIYANNLAPKSDDKNNQVSGAQENGQTIPVEKELFTFIDKDGVEYTIEDFENKPIALLLWRSDADGAIDLIEKYATYIPRYEERVNFIILNTGEKNNDIISMAENAGLGVKLYYNQDSSAMEYYGITKLPYMMFIDETGKVDQEKALEDMDRDLDDYLSANLDLLSGTY